MRTVPLLLFALLLCCGCSPEPPPVPAPPIPLDIRVSGEIPDDPKVPATLALADGSSLSCGIERRGGFSYSFPKHSWSLALDRDTSLAGLPTDDDWILNANHIDKTFLRHVLAFETFRRMNPARNEAPGTAFAEVSVNGAYNGLYVVMEKLDRSTLGISKMDTAGVVFKEPPLFRPDLSTFRAEKPGNFHHQTYPKIKKSDRSAVLETTREFLVNSPDSTFHREITRYFDLDNIIDWHLLLLVTNNSDGILKNFYLFRRTADSPLLVAPWDYDHSLGRDGDNELNMIRPLDVRRSLLIDRLLEWPDYRRRLHSRYTTLSAAGQPLNWEELHRRVSELAEYVRPYALRNFTRWSPAGWPYYDDNGFDQEVDLIHEYLDLRHGQLSAYFSTLEK